MVAIQFNVRGVAAAAVVALAWWLAAASASARPGLGGGGFHGGGARPALGSGMGGGLGGGGLGGGQASLGGAAGGRPNPGAAGRPGLSNINRPGGGGTLPGSRPSLGGSPPSLGGISRPNFPNVSVPPAGGAGPGGGIGWPSNPIGGSRPAVPLPELMPPINRPTFPGAGGNRPGFPNLPGGGAGNRPGFPDRPNIDRPGTGNRPDLSNRPNWPNPAPGFPDRPNVSWPNVPGRPQLPERPSFPDRPNLGGIERPALPDRPNIGGGNRPNLPDLPNIGGGNRPSLPDRPNIGGGNRPNLPDRPSIGGTRPIHPDRPIIGGPNWPNRPVPPVAIVPPAWGWNPGWGWHPGWTWRPGHPWYHGPWNWHWGHVWWYRPPTFFVVWGLGSWANSVPFFNPYYVPASAPVSYAQPVVINVSTDGAAAANAAGESEQAMKHFDAGMAAFKAGQYAESLTSLDAALKLLPGDPVLHEMRALALFAVGKFQPAAAALNALLASAPGMDWTTLASLYGNLDDYTAQLRALEAHLDANPDDAAATFVLAYLYLVMGHNEQAVEMLQRVVKLQPKDTTAQRLLVVLEGPKAAATPAADSAVASQNAPSTDLVGRWLASAGDSKIELTVTDDAQFAWRATPAGQPPVELSGNLTTTSDLLILETDSQGAMVGQVKSGGADKFQFIVSGGPPSDTGLTFTRQK